MCGSPGNISRKEDDALSFSAFADACTVATFIYGLIIPIVKWCIAKIRETKKK